MAKEGQPCTGCGKTESDGAVFKWYWETRCHPQKRLRRSKCKDCENARNSETRRTRHKYEPQYSPGDPDAPLKECTGCRVPKPATTEYFHLRSESKDGLYNACKVCRSIESLLYRDELYKERKAMYDATYYQNNPDKVSARRRNREAREVGAEGVHTDEDIAHIREEQNGLCYYCEVVLEPDFHVDHKQPLSRGGSNWPSNLCCACPTCNISKGDKTEAEFWGYLEIAGRMSEIEERRRLREVKRVTVME